MDRGELAGATTHEPALGGPRPGVPARSVLRLLRGVRAVSFERGLALGAALGRAWVGAGGARVADARVNLRIAFPEWSERERERVLVCSFENLGRSIVEFAWIGGLSPQEFRARVRVEGEEHLEAAQKATPGGGTFVLTAHFGSWEFFAAAMVGHGFPLSVVHRERSSVVLDEVIAGVRGAGGAQMLPRGNAARGALRALRDGRMLCIPFDQNADREQGVFVPFFGRLACTRGTPARLAMRSGAPVVPAFIHREPGGVRHVVHVQPALELLPEAGNREAALRANVARMTAVIEREVRRAPEQWLWIHRRWHTQPPGEPRPAYR